MNFIKKWILCALCVAVFPLLLTVGAQAEPVVLTTAAQIQELMDGALPLDGEYLLGNDISLAELERQVSIGSAALPFSGTFDGNGHTISGIAITASADVCGFFGAATGATIRNLTISGSVTSAYARVGGFIGQATLPLTVSQCENNVTVHATGSGKTYIGGLIGSIVTVKGESAVFLDVVNNASVTAAGKYVGGFVGGFESNALSNVIYSFTNCTNNGAICASEGNSVGGFIGYFLSNHADSKLVMSLCRNTGDVTANQYAGGFVGCFGNASSGSKTAATFTKLANSGSITSGNCAGGVLGVCKPLTANNVKITQCTNRGALVADRAAGGIVGTCSNIALAVAECFNSGTYPADSTSATRPNLPIASTMVASADTQNNYYSGAENTAEAYGVFVADEDLDRAEFYVGFSSGDWVFTVNGPEIAEFHEHSIEDGVCTTCGYREQCAHLHTIVRVLSVATCVSEGMGENYCTDCRQVLGEAFVLSPDMENHVGDAVWCATETGYAARCLRCGSDIMTADEPRIFVSDTARGNGLTAETCLGTLAESYAAIAATGGRIVVVERCTVPSNFTEPAHTNRITITQEIDGISYRTTENAGLYADYKSYMMNGPLDFENITIRGNGKDSDYNCFWLVTQFHPVAIRAGVSCVDFGSSNTFYYSPVIIGGVRGGKDQYDTVSTGLNPSIRIESGEWTISGFSSSVAKFFSGTADIEITGGVIRNLYIGCTNSGDAGAANVRISGGRFIGNIIATQTGTMFGSLNITLSGGDFTDLKSIRGAAGDVVNTLDISALEESVADGILTILQDIDKIITKEGVITNMSTVSAFQSGVFTASNGVELPYRYYIPEDYETTDREYPVFLYMHGSGSRGTDNERQLTTVGAALNTAVFNSKYDCIMIAPQAPARTIDGFSVGWVRSSYIGGPLAAEDWENGAVTHGEYLYAAAELLNYFLTEYRADTSRVYASGSSNGGGAVFALAAYYPQVFAAVVPLAGTTSGTVDEDAAFPYAGALTKTTIWTFHGDADTTCSVEGTRRLVKAIKEAGGTQIIYTEVAGAGHTSAVWGAPVQTEGFMEWLFAQERTDFTNTLPGEFVPAEMPLDVNGDGKITLVDALMALKYALNGKKPYTLRHALRILKATAN